MSSRNSLFLGPTLPVAVGDPSYRINIAGYALKNYKLLDPEGYTIMCETGKYCNVLNFFPNTKTIVLEGNSQSHLLFTDFPYRFIPELAQELDVTPEAAFQKSVDFFADKRVLVQPTGVQGKVYKFMFSMQNCIPVTYAANAVSSLATTGMTGVKIITAAPLTFVGVTYIGSIFFSYCGYVAGNNLLGDTLKTTGYILTRPMRGVEITLNGLILQPLSNVTGVPLMLNGTNRLLIGTGINITDYAKLNASFERLVNATSKKANWFKKVYYTLKEAMKDFN